MKNRSIKWWDRLSIHSLVHSMSSVVWFTFIFSLDFSFPLLLNYRHNHPTGYLYFALIASVVCILVNGYALAICALHILMVIGIVVGFAIITATIIAAVGVIIAVAAVIVAIGLGAIALAICL